MFDKFTSIDHRMTRWMAAHGVAFLRLSVGAVFIWFGALKFFPGVSAADRLATDTITTLTFGIIDAPVSRILLAMLETAIGLGLISGKFIRLTLLMLLGQMLGTITPLFLFPELTWQNFPLVPTLEGQYIIKNLVLISAGVTIGSTVRGGGVIEDPKAFQAGRDIVGH